MISPQFRAHLAKPARTAVVIWGAFLASPLLYAAVSFLVASQRPVPPATPSFALPALAALAVAALAGGVFTWRISFTDAALRQAPRAATAITPAPAVPAAATPREQKLCAVATYGQTRCVIAWACFESAGLFGVLLVLLGHPPQRALPFLAAAFAAIALHGPRLLELVERADALLPRD